MRVRASQGVSRPAEGRGGTGGSGVHGLTAVKGPQACLDFFPFSFKKFWCNIPHSMNFFYGVGYYNLDPLVSVFLIY